MTGESGSLLAQPSGVMKVRHFKTKSFQAGTAAAVEAAVNAWCAGAGEVTWIGFHVESLGTDLVAMLTYAD